ncbi:DciA family protein [Aliinostoc sp. HNIBRCY26]|uniref:DciA family protein n=1 Tax=Aliinostoc sp. HNIBRCY26 TaxID=3418997 RepID=UPI003D073CAE
MSLKPINDILGVLEQQAKWQADPLTLILQSWAEVVGSVAADHSRPLSTQRDVLRVATSSAAWAQNLTFSRQTLLLKLNSKLSMSLVDIRFSTAGWQKPPDLSSPPTNFSPKEHPSYLGDSHHHYTVTQADQQNVNQVFESWAKVTQTRSQGLPLCPQCQCPSPSGELLRWGVCALCSVKQSLR